ncbi:EEF1A lysine methyltransferase 3-like [Rhodamnia argentea]|uniref:EEF1A lysine methyltransferase 3-like n=1 Tax=Rhodamnia argentea TaxID=178133 RepID=A0A8B8PFB9_9MYRT|nr:EEF1A lysine methyltransferase 3-like [Rhodamnia argentea]
MTTRKIEIAGHQYTVLEQEDVYDSVTGHPLTGSWLWNSSLVLSDWLVTEAHLHLFPLNGKNVIELGAGSAGLPGLTAARLGASRVFLTDVAPILPGLRRNVEANGAGEQVEVRELAWGSEESARGIGEEFDVVLMSDVFFGAEEARELGKTLRGLCGERTRVWAASEVRDWTGFWLEELGREGFGAVELAFRLGGPGYEGELVGEGSFVVYEILRMAQNEVAQRSWLESS